LSELADTAKGKAKDNVDDEEAEDTPGEDFADEHYSEESQDEDFINMILARDVNAYYGMH
jgi:hypothetical protein